MEFRHGDSRILVDCGLFQGSRSLEVLNRAPFAFDAARIDAVILTHAHIDHCGLLPRLVAEGFSGDIWCTPATAELLEFMLRDAGRIQEGDAMRRNRRKDRADMPPIAPIYTEQDAIKAWQQGRPVPLENWFEPAPGFRARLWNAGHILGSASVELQAGDTHLLCSGDLGPEYKAFHPDPEGPSGFDHVICESTYGDRPRDHQTIEARRTALAAEVKLAMQRGGNLIIPVFALERTQELLLDLGVLIETGQIDPAQVFIDSPLATRATSIFARHSASLEDTGGKNVFANPAFHFVEDSLESIRLNSVSGAIILAASGMCEAGRIRHHLRHNLHKREATILFVGFQAEGTLGRVILEGAKRVRIWGEDIVVRAQVRRMDTYSAHADQQDLLAWVKARRPIHGTLFLTHGEEHALQSLQQLAQAEAAGTSIRTPEMGDTYRLAGRAAAIRVGTGDPVRRDALGRDWQNYYADFAANLKQELTQIGDGTARERAVAEMRGVLESYKQAHAKRAMRTTTG